MSDAKAIFRLLFDAVAERIGEQMCSTITAYDRTSLDDDPSMERVREFMGPVKSIFGEQGTRRMCVDALSALYPTGHAIDLVDEILARPVAA